MRRLVEHGGGAAPVEGRGGDGQGHVPVKRIACGATIEEQTMRLVGARPLLERWRVVRRIDASSEDFSRDGSVEAGEIDDALIPPRLRCRRALRRKTRRYVEGG